MEKVLMIGIDGADYGIVRKLIEEGRLKNITGLYENGHFSRLMSTIPPLSPAAWTSVFTGVPPHKHGIYGHLKQEMGDYFYRPVTSRDRKVKAIWNLLSERNRKTIAVNIPFSYPPEKVNGIIITGFGSPGTWSNFVYPSSLRKIILEKFHNFDVDFGEDKLDSGVSIYDFESSITQIEEEHANLFTYLLNQNEWDFGVIVLRSLDVIQHFAFSNQKFVMRHYERVDELVGKILEEVFENRNSIRIVVCSDHGFRSIHRRFYVNNFLEKEGYLKMKSRSNTLLEFGIDSERIRRRMRRMNLKAIIGKVEHSRLAKHLLKILPSSSHQYLFDADWGHTKAFFYRGSSGLVKVNVKGREPQGCVEETKIVHVESQLKSKLRKITDQETGVKVLRNVFLKEELGIDQYHYPELILVPNVGYEIMDYSADGCLLDNIQNRPGEHDFYGIFISNFRPKKTVKSVWDIGNLVIKVVV